MLISIDEAIKLAQSSKTVYVHTKANAEQPWSVLTVAVHKEQFIEQLRGLIPETQVKVSERSNIDCAFFC